LTVETIDPADAAKVGLTPKKIETDISRIVNGRYKRFLEQNPNATVTNYTLDGTRVRFLPNPPRSVYDPN